MTTQSRTSAAIEGANLIAGTWSPIPGDAIVSTMPAAPDQVVWSGSSSVGAVHEAIAAITSSAPSAMFPSSSIFADQAEQDSSQACLKFIGVLSLGGPDALNRGSASSSGMSVARTGSARS